MGVRRARGKIITEFAVQFLFLVQVIQIAMEMGSIAKELLLFSLYCIWHDTVLLLLHCHVVLLHRLQ